jgi:hypothetical protein
MNPRCPTCGCFVSPLMPVDYCRQCETSAAIERERESARRRMERAAIILLEPNRDPGDHD